MAQFMILTIKGIYFFNFLKIEKKAVKRIKTHTVSTKIVNKALFLIHTDVNAYKYLLGNIFFLLKLFGVAFFRIQIHLGQLLVCVCV